jgi:outer membrane protein assembly factor BamB
VLWRHRRPRSYTAPLVAGGRVFVLGADRSLTALDGGNGAKLWSLQRPAEPLVLRQAGVLLPVGNTLVAGLAGRLVESTPTTAACVGGAHRLGARHQRRRAPGRPGGRRRPRGAGDLRPRLPDRRRLRRRHPGSLRWSKRPTAPPAWPATTSLYGAEADGTVMAWNAATGERAWRPSA